MSRYPHKDLPIKKPKFDNKPFANKAAGRLGSSRAPLALRVQTEARKQELLAICADKKWVGDIEVNAEEDEDIRELTFLQDKQVVAISTRKAGRNDPCPCDSGKKYKQCCGQ